MKKTYVLLLATVFFAIFCFLFPGDVPGNPEGADNFSRGILVGELGGRNPGY